MGSRGRHGARNEGLALMNHQVSLFDRVFATTIAFLLPGLGVLVGAAMVTPVVAGWFGAASNSPQIVGFLFVLAAALAIGMVLTAIRWWVFEKATVCGFQLVPPTSPINEAKRSQHFAEYEDIRFQHYYYYLAFGNMSIAVPVAIATWLVGSDPWPERGRVFAVFFVGALLSLTLGSAAREAIKRYTDRRIRLLGTMPGVTEGAAVAVVALAAAEGVDRDQGGAP